MSTQAPYLEQLGQIDIPMAALDHRFFNEALACARMMNSHPPGDNRVIGTGNTRTPELYGWGHSVPAHADNIGWMYLCPLFIAGRSTLTCLGARNELLQVELKVGSIVRMWDFAMHSTKDDGPVVAMFIGAFESPSDAGIEEQFRAGVQLLANGAYYAAPRVRQGFQVLLDDECIAASDGHQDVDTMLLADAKRQRRSIQTCAKCDRPAVRLDDHWPYHQENNRCRRHLRRDGSKS